MGERAGQRLERQIGARVRLALGQRSGRHRGRGGQSRQRQPVVEQGRRTLAHRLQAGRAQLVGDPRAVPHGHLRPRLQHRLHPPRSAARHMRRILAVLRGQDLDDRAGLAMGAGAEHEGVVVKFHAISTVIPAKERQRRRAGTHEHRFQTWSLGDVVAKTGDPVFMGARSSLREAGT